MIDQAFFELVYAIVSEIPYGTVATYGQIAKLAGRANNARLVGTALRCADMFGEFPCHRVVNSVGRLAPGFEEQKALLQEEGVPFCLNGCVDLKKAQWKI